MDRRKFLLKTALFGTGLIIPVGIDSWMSYSVTPQPSFSPSQRLIVVFLRGAIDGLNVVVPYNDENYYLNRPSLAVDAPGSSDGLLDLDGKFGLHPALQELMPLWQEKSLAFVNCCGLTDSNRSHFLSQNLMEIGTLEQDNDTDNEGWMNRLLGLISQDNPTQAINMGSSTNRILLGTNPVFNLPQQNRRKSKKSDFTNKNSKLNQLFTQLYSGTDEVSRAYREGQKARQIVDRELREEMAVSDKGTSNNSAFAREANQIATLMKSKANSQLAFINFRKWDTHANESATLSRLLPSLGSGLATLRKTLGNEYQNTTIIVMSEFGRTVKENGNRGTDHGYGNVMWVLGGSVKGGKIYGKWEGLAQPKLYQGRDLPVHTDYREVISNVLTNNFQLSQDSLNKVFPNFDYQPKFSVV